MKSQMLKSLKKLKTWSRRKKKTKTNVHESLQLPSTTHCHCCYCSCAASRPSAPPLPTWLDEQIRSAASGSDLFPVSSLDDHFTSEPQFSFPEVVSEIAPLYPPLPVATTPSYQQYTVQTPIYGVPVIPDTSTREKCGGFFGCVVGSVTNLVRCFCSCFRIRSLN